MQFSTSVRNAMLNAIEATIGTSAVLKFRSGAKPTNITDASTGTVIATLQLPADWMLDAANGVKAKQGTWEDTSADAAGTVGHYEITASDGTTVHERGTVTATGGGGDMEIQNTSVAAGQDVSVTAKTYTAGNAS